ncbi:hypothetical protein CASFOL_032943 [Castilleja foliolosa]|uniref:RING-type E3 ubiquitin transferase BRCA1 n=1 Tax=Castilleja foliolosa TaxID=1961234 RepID=A0ABD3C3I4_9LAMI
MEDDLLRHQRSGMESVLATVSGYHGSQRFNLIKLISQAGASYVGNMSPSVTHLVCRKFEGRKYELAKKLKMVIINHRWVEECVKKGRRVSEKPYTYQCGKEVGPIVLDIPLKINMSKTHQSKALKNSKRPVVDIGCEDTDNAAWTDSILFDELDDAGPSQPAYSGRLKKRDSTSLNTQSKGRRLVKKHTSNNDGLSTSNELEGCEEMKASTRNSNINNNSSVIISDSSDDERHQSMMRSKGRKLVKKIVFPSKQDNNGGGRDVVEDITHVNDEKQNVISENFGEPDCLNLIDVDADAGKRLPPSSELSCVICWTDFSSTRGLLPCGHRFCFKCIQEWSDHMRSSGKPSTCPLCKASFICITKIDAISSDQKIYSQSIPHDISNTDLYILPEETYTPFVPPSNVSEQVCCMCFSREPEDLLTVCDVCKIRCVHHYCLDPPLYPWTCVHCQSLQQLYHHSRYHN